MPIALLIVNGFRPPLLCHTLRQPARDQWCMAAGPITSATALQVNATSRRILTGALACFLPTFGACKADGAQGCVIGPCGPPAVSLGLSLVGFPPGRVDRSTVVGSGFRGTMRIGDSVTLYLVRSLGPGSTPADTIRTGLAWALSDSTAARIAIDVQGGGRITAIATGKVGQVIANGTRYDIISCFNPFGGCDRLGELAVVP